MKLPSVYTDSSFKLVCDSATAGRNSRCRSDMKSAICELKLPLTFRVPVGLRSRSVTSDARPTRGRLRQLKDIHNSVTIGNKIHVCFKFFAHEVLRNHLFQYCPQIMYHSMCVCVCACVCRPIYKGNICPATCQAVTKGK
jgi:hypothetical protein